MPAIGLAAVAALVVWLAIRGSLTTATVTVLAVMLLVPDTVAVPGTPAWLPISRIAIYAFAFGIALRVLRGDIDTRVLRPTRLQAAMAAFVALAFVLGVAVPAVPTGGNTALFVWVNFVDQLVFACALVVAARVLGPRRVIALLAAVAAAVGVVAVLEHVTGSSWSRLWFLHTKQLYSVAGHPLERRAGGLRIRGAAQYALAFGWITTMLLPVMVAWALQSARRRALVVPVLIALAMVWTVSRSATIGSIVALSFVVAAAVWHSRSRTVVLGGVVLVAALILTTPVLHRPFDAAHGSDSDAARARRLSSVTADVAPYAITGEGYGQLVQTSDRSTDNTYLLTYAGTGAIGVSVLGVTLLTAIAGAASAAMRARGADRLVAAACLGGLVAGAGGAAVTDLFSQTGTACPFWLLAAIAVVVGERAPSLRRARVRPQSARLLLPVAGAFAGTLLAVAVPATASLTYRFDTMPVTRLVTANDDRSYAGRFGVHTACALQTAAMEHVAGAAIQCRDPRQGGSIGEVRITGTETAVRDAADAAQRGGTLIRGYRALPVTGVVVGRPTWARTAPVWGAIAGAAGAILLPAMAVQWPRRRRVAVAAVQPA